MNPFQVLEFTPGLVRLIQERPEQLVRIAESHRQWLLADVHPDRGALGSTERAEQFTSALTVLKDPDAHSRAVQEFLAGNESEREVYVSELRQLRGQLARVESLAQEHARKVTRLQEQLASKAEQFGTALAGWFTAALRATDLVVLRSGEREQLVSLAGSVLVVDLVSTMHCRALTVGENRRILHLQDIRRSRMKDHGSEPMEHRLNERKELYLLGSYIGVERGADSSIEISASRSEIAPLALAVAPFVEVGRPVVVYDRRADGPDYLRLFGPLLEIKLGRLEPVRKFRWVASTATVAKKKTGRARR